MSNVDIVFRTLGNIVCESEKIYLSLFNLSTNSDIKTIVTTVGQQLIKLPKDTKVMANEDVGKEIVLLAYVTLRSKYREEKRLDLTMFPALTEISRILLVFTEKSSIADKEKAAQNMRLLNKIVLVMSKIDEVSMKARYGLGYRYMRLFILLVLFGSYTNASIVATFILEQLEVVDG